MDELAKKISEDSRFDAKLRNVEIGFSIPVETSSKNKRVQANARDRRGGKKFWMNSLFLR
jgi:hypothetical protein